VSTRRYPSIDALRGVALAAMIVYHAAWDLDYFGYFDWALYTDLGWIAFRDAILVAFLGLSGVSLILATRGGVDWRRFVRRRLWIAAGAAAITVFSLVATPESPIWFGVLHFVAVASFIVLPARNWPWPVLTLLALVIFGAIRFVQPGFPVFDSPWLQWVGLTTHEPQSADYVPLLPWLAAVYAGMALGRLFVNAPANAPNARRVRDWQPRGAARRALVWSGRESLLIYLLHQPVLVALCLFAGLFVAPPTDPALVEAFRDECRASCVREGSSAMVCARFCDCAAQVVERDFGWVRLHTGNLTAEELELIQSEAEQCLRDEP